MTGTDLSELHKWRYSFLDLPLWGWGVRTQGLEKRLFRFLEPEAPAIRNGLNLLFEYLKKPVDKPGIEDLVKKALWVKIVRESDAFASLRMTKKRLYRYFRIEGIEHLIEAADRKRPVVLLSSHFGSFYTLAIGASVSGIPLYPIARTVDNSSASPLVWRLYARANYAFTEKRLTARYLYTDFSGKVDRSIVSLLKAGGVFLAMIDLPLTLFPHKRIPVELFGLPSSLPSGFVQSGLRYNAIFLTAWNTVEHDTNGDFYRFLKIEGPMPEGLNAQEVLQRYADRLTNQIVEKPWQWMGLQIISQYNESVGTQNA